MSYFLDKIKNEYGDSFIKRFEINRKSSFRINLNVLNNKKEIEDFLKENNIEYNNPIYYDGAYIIENENEYLVKESSLYKEGKIYFQNLSTIIPILSYEFKENVNVLDMCAAPGGKTTLLSSLMKNKINITSVEIKKSRYERLVHNINMQKSKAFPMNIDARNMDSNFKFDVVMLDAPCTGSGTIENNVDDEYITNELLLKVNKTQYTLLKKASEITNKNGIIIYMTCSVFKEENELIIDKFLKENSSFKLYDLKDFKNEINKERNLELSEERNFYIKILPNEYYEGFFFSILEKTK